MPRKLLSLNLIIIGSLCLLQSSTPATLSNTHQETLQQPTPQTTAVPDISGMYIGKLDYPAAGYSGSATLFIHGRRVNLSGSNLNLQGTMAAPQADGEGVSATMTLAASDPAADGKVVSVKLTVKNRRVVISAANGSRAFRFTGSKGAPPQATPPETGATNANVSTTNTNVSTTNTNPTFFPEIDSTDRVEKRKPRGNFKATGGQPPNSETNAGTPPNSVPLAPSNTTGNEKVEPSLYDQLKDDAKAVFSTPDSMRLDETRDIELLVSPTKSAEELKNELSEHGQSGQATTKYSKMMEAQLVGHGFDIAQVGPAIQPVEPGQTTRWKWQIKPKQGGKQRLDLTLNAVLNEGKDRILVQTLHREIAVNVKLSQRASGWLSGLKDMQWLWAVIIVPLGTLVAAWWRRRRKKRQPREPKEPKEARQPKPRKKH